VASVLILTSAYPFLPGEQFIEDEIGYWDRSAFSDIFILPSVSRGEPRETPHRVSVLTPASGSRKNRLLAPFLKALFSKVFLKELRYLGSTKNLTPTRAWLALREVLLAKLAQRELEKYLKVHCIDVVYSYWNNAGSYAACEMKRKGIIGKVVTRIHGADLYEERRRLNYMPLKRQYVMDFDKVFCLSSAAKAYFLNRYGGAERALAISPLGVPLPGTLSVPSDPPSIHIVSLSYCVPVKRIDKIMDGVRLFAQSNPDKDITWTHIGAGQMFQRFSDRAQALSRTHSNLTCRFLGDVKNEQVKRFFLDNKVDVLVNCSESEGVPVSIMEAMSCGVPAIAPDVGSVSCLVSEDRGYLMSENPEAQELADVLSAFSNAPESVKKQKRIAARSYIEENYSSALNYPRFISEVESTLK
jgi:glycosyltransferase involved in cell wall biosynthesis